MSNSFSGLGFIIDMVLSFVILAFTLRIFLALFSANTQNPVTQSIIKITNPDLENFDAHILSNVIAQIAKSTKSSYVVVSSSVNSRYMSPLLAVELEAGYFFIVLASISGKGL